VQVVQKKNQNALDNEASLTITMCVTVCASVCTDKIDPSSNDSAFPQIMDQQDTSAFNTDKLSEYVMTTSGLLLRH
jgi:hypothetical protein